MGTVEDFNKFVIQNGGSMQNMDENLKLKYEDKKDRIWWASVYGVEFRKVPKGFFTSQNVYREFCVLVAGMMPKKRRSEDFDQYLRERLSDATMKETLPGLEEGAIVGHAVFSVISRFHRKACDYDNPERKLNVARGDPYFIETRPEGPGYPEIFIRINYLMDCMTELQSFAQFERKISREEVVDWLMLNGRGPYSTGASPRRLRSTYPIPFHSYMRWRLDDESKDEEGVAHEGT